MDITDDEQMYTLDKFKSLKKFSRHHKLIDDSKQFIFKNKLIKFVIVIYAKNCKDTYLNNLESIFSQIYKRYRVIYINDNSSDNTHDKVKEFVNENGILNMKIINNKQSLGLMQSRFEAYNSCFSEEVCVFINGHDSFTDLDTLSYLNKVFHEIKILAFFGGKESDINNIVNIDNPIYKLLDITEKNMNRETYDYFPELQAVSVNVLKYIGNEHVIDQNGNFYNFNEDYFLFSQVIELIKRNYFINQHRILYYSENNNIFEMQDNYIIDEELEEEIIPNENLLIENMPETVIIENIPQSITIEYPKINDNLSELPSDEFISNTSKNNTYNSDIRIQTVKRNFLWMKGFNKKR
jgi:glycosyltransferase involved in cell wall biosynthesis